MTYNQWDVAVVPFPFVDSAQAKPRPVVIVSRSAFIEATHHTIAAMITSSQRQYWQGDTKITNLVIAGLKKPSIIRLKLFTLDMRFSPRPIGSLSRQDQESFRENVSEMLF